MNVARPRSSPATKALRSAREPRDDMRSTREAVRERLIQLLLQPAGTPMGITSAAEEGMRCDHSKRAVRAPHHAGKDYVAATGSDVLDGSISARVDPTIALALIQWDGTCTNAARVQNDARRAASQSSCAWAAMADAAQCTFCGAGRAHSAHCCARWQILRLTFED